MLGYQVGQYIQSKGGVVTAEQLAPYLDVTPEDMEKVEGFTNEAYVVGIALCHMLC